MTDAHPLALVESLARRTMEYPFKVWGFGEGIVLEALWEVDALVPELQCRPFVLDLFERWLSRPIVEPDHSAPGMLLLMAYQANQDPRYLKRALELVRHMLDLPRTTQGATLHRPNHPDFYAYLYVDCMEVDAPFLCKLGAVTGDATYTDAGVRQLLAYCKLLQDEEAGLFYHQFNATTQSINGAFWGRGNGWALLGMLKTLLLLPRDHIAYGEIAERFELLADALAARQLENGGWPTALDQPATYEEASLAAMFGIGLHLGMANGLLSPAFRETADRAWRRTTERIRDGFLEGVSVATPPGDSAHYATVETGSGYPWGQGPALWFAAAHTLI